MPSNTWYWAIMKLKHGAGRTGWAMVPGVDLKWIGRNMPSSGDSRATPVSAASPSRPAEMAPGSGVLTGPGCCGGKPVRSIVRSDPSIS